MAYDLTEDDMQDRSRIDADQVHELRYWSDKFHVTEDELRNAVRRVGPVPERVKAHLIRRAP